MTSRKKTDCDKIDRVTEFALQALPARDRTDFDAHIEECAECRNELAAIRPIVDALVDWPTDVLRPSTPLWARLAERIGPELSREAFGPAEDRWTEEPDWKQVAPGIACKVLSTDAASERVSMLVSLEPGTSYPAHTHAGVEELHLLDGELWIDDRKLVPGDYNRAEPGTADRHVWSETGCTCVLITSFLDILG